MAVQGARLVRETGDRVVFEHVRYGVPIRFTESGSVFARTVRTTVSARFLTPAGPVFQIRHRTLPFRTTMRRRDFEYVGDFRVISDRPGSTFALLGPRCVEILGGLGRAAALESDGAEITLTLSGQIQATQVSDVTELLVAMGQADIFGLSELRALPGAVYHPPGGDYDFRSEPWVELRVPGRVDLAPIAVAGVAQTWAGRAYDHHQPFAARVDDGTADDLPEVGLTDDQRGLLTEVGSGVLAAREGALTFTWTGVETRRDRLLAAARLLAGFPAVHTTGIYR